MSLNAVTDTDTLTPSVVDTTEDQEKKVVDNPLDQKTQEVAKDTLKKKTVEEDQETKEDTAKDTKSPLADLPEMV